MTILPLLSFLFILIIPKSICFFTTNIEEELLLFNGFDRAVTLPEAEKICGILDGTLLNPQEDITFLDHNLDVGRTGAWLQRRDCEDGQCCGDYAFRRNRLFGAAELIVEQRFCDEKGYVLCHISPEIERSRKRLADVMDMSDDVKQDMERVTAYDKKLTEYESLESASKAEVEAFALKLGRQLYPPKMDIHDSYGLLSHMLQYELDTKAGSEAVDGKIAGFWEKEAGRESGFDKKSKDVKGYADKVQTELEQSYFAISLSHADLDKIFRGYDARIFKEIESDMKQKEETYEYLENESETMAKKAGEEINDSAEEGFEKMSALFDELLKVNETRLQFESFTEESKQKTSRLLSDATLLSGRLDRISSFDYDSHVKQQSTAYASSQRQTIYFFLKTSYSLMGLLLVIFIANSIFIWKYKPQEDVQFEMMLEDDL